MSSRLECFSNEGFSVSWSVHPRTAGDSLIRFLEAKFLRQCSCRALRRSVFSTYRTKCVRVKRTTIRFDCHVSVCSRSSLRQSSLTVQRNNWTDCITSLLRATDHLPVRHSRAFYRKFLRQLSRQVRKFDRRWALFSPRHTFFAQWHGNACLPSKNNEGIRYIIIILFI